MSIASKVCGLLQSVYGIARTSVGVTSSVTPWVWPTSFALRANTQDFSFDANGTFSATNAVIGLSSVYAGSNFVTGSGGRIGFTNASYGATVDTTLVRAAARVVGITDGSTAAGTLRSVPITPAQITANQDNYAPTAGGRNYRLSTDASRDLTGLSISQVDGQECFFLNVGAQNIVLKHDVTSTAANRFLCAGSADITLTPNDIARLVYDSTSARWRVGKL